MTKSESSGRMNLSDRLLALRRFDSLRKWESLDDRRFCRCCRKFIPAAKLRCWNATVQTS